MLHELHFGVERLPRTARRRLLEQYLEQVVSRLPVLTYDLAAARWHAEARARAEKRGRALPHHDAQLAAIAAANGLTVVTRNLRDFAALEGVDCVSWHT